MTEMTIYTGGYKPMKKWGIIGALLFAGAVVFGYFCKEAFVL